MKHLLPLLLSAVLLLGACGKTPKPSNTPPVKTVTTQAAKRTNQAATSADSPVASAVTTDEVLPPQITETATETVEAPVTDSQVMALRLTQAATPNLASPWKEGVHYHVLSPVQPTSAMPGQIEITEAFWYGCPHCYALDPALETWRKQLKPNYVSFVRLPVMWGPLQRTHARLFYTAELLGKLNELHAEIFQEIQQKKSPLSTTAQIAALFVAYGVNEADFKRAYASPATEASLKHAQDLGERYRIDSVPTLIINGKYVTDVSMAGGPAQLLVLLNDLAAREKSN